MGRMVPKFGNPVTTITLMKSNNLKDMEEKLDTAEILISRWDTSTSSKMLFQSNAEEVRVFIDTVENLHRLMEHLSASGTNVTQLIRAQRLMKTAMARLQNEFHKILLSNRKPIDPGRASSARPSCYSSAEVSVSRPSCSDGDDDSSSSCSSNRSSADRIFESDMVPPDAVEDLRKIVHRMAKSGYARECVRIFALTRKSVVEESLYNLGIMKAKLEDVRKMEWKLLDEMIKGWIFAAKIGIRVLFYGEKRLCDDVFEGLHKMRDACFVETAKEGTERLLAFAEAVATRSRAPERMFRILDLYEALADVMPDIEEIYSNETCRSVQEQAKRTLVQLGDAARRILAEFDKAVEKDKCNVPVPGGTIHPLTRYVMNYLSFLSDYKETLVNIIIDTPLELHKVLPDKESVPALSIRLGWTVFLLMWKLEKNSDLYKDVALSNLFLMNNLHYIVEKVKGSELMYILEKRWVRKQQNKVTQYAVNHEGAAWMKVLSCVTDEEVPLKDEVWTGQALKEKLKRFNLAMEEVKRRHEGMVVSDIGLREKIRDSITEKLIPSYTSFLSRFRRRLGGSDTKFIKYTPEEVHDFVLHVFKMNPSIVSSKTIG